MTLPNGQHVAHTAFVADSHADTATRELLIATIARAVYDAFAPLAPPPNRNCYAYLSQNMAGLLIS